MDNWDSPRPRRVTMDSGRVAQIYPYHDAYTRYREDRVQDVRREQTPEEVRVYKERRVWTEGREDPNARRGRSNRRDNRSRSPRHESTSSEASLSPGPRQRRRQQRRDQGLGLTILGAGAQVARQDHEIRVSHTHDYYAQLPHQQRQRQRQQQQQQQQQQHHRPPPNAVSKSKPKPEEEEEDTDSGSATDSEEERRAEAANQHKKIRRKKLLTAGLATVATVHVASGIYGLLDNRDKRFKSIEKGEMTKEEMKRDRNYTRLQDAATLAVIAMGAKGAYTRWKGTQALHGKQREVVKKLSGKEGEAK